MAGAEELIQIVDAAIAEAVGKAGAWIACRRGCYECCIGPFPISRLDAGRLRAGLHDLESRDPDRAREVRRRAAAYRDGEDELCPALDPADHSCDLYEARPSTCRMFGPAIRCADGSVATCELCFDGATDAEIEACAVTLDIDALEGPLLSEADEETTVAVALR